MVQPQNLLDDIDGAAEAIDSDALRFILGQDHAGQRLDKVLAQLIPDHSRARIQGWIEAGYVQINRVLSTRQTQVVGCGDEVIVQVQPSDQVLAFEPEDIPFYVIDECDHWLVVNKQAGLVVHPGAGNWRGTLLNGLLYRYPELCSVPRAGIVHRLDKDTTGLMVVAKTHTAQTHLVRQLQDRSVKRLYRALAHGWLDLDQLTVDRAIGRDPRVPVRMSVSPSGSSKPAITHVTRLCAGKLNGLPVTQISCRLETGRTHQIRVHLASLNHPLIGDLLYGGKNFAGVARQMLHAESLSFVDPATEQWVAFQSPLPDDLRSVVSQIDWSTGAVL